jgi:hypothetical protein
MKTNGTGRVIAVATLSHAATTALVILLLSLYGDLTGGKEAWPALIPVVALSFVLETSLLFIFLRLQRGAAFLTAMGSWQAGDAAW